MEGSSLRRHSRRSHPNLTQLSIKPLTPNFPLAGADDDAAAPADDAHLTATPQSYIAPRSLPQTPSILSRSGSRSRGASHQRAAGSRSSAALNELDPGLLLSPRRLKGGGHVRSTSTGLRLQQPAAADSTGWILHAATALTTSAAESKGQAWLATRTSSTSLADAAAAVVERRDVSYAADDEFSPVSHRWASRPQSRFGSRAASRRGSRVGLMTPLGLKTPGDRDDAQSDYFGSVRADFDDDEDDDPAAEDGEMKRVIWGHVGGWVDWAVGWMDFRADEDDIAHLESMQQDAAAAQPEDDRPRRRIRWKQRRPGHDGRARQGREGAPDVPPAPENEGVAQDAVWLWSLARNNLV